MRRSHGLLLSRRRQAAPAALATALLLAALPAAAQSPFALNNLGQKIESGDARMVGRGGWGLAVGDTIDPGFKNVAGLARIREVVLKFTAYGLAVASDNGELTRATKRVLAPEVRVALPVLTGRLAVTAGYSVERSFQYHTRIDTTWSAWGDTLGGSLQFAREGSLFRVPLGVGWAVLPQLSLGGSLNLERGLLRENLYQIFETPQTYDGDPLYQRNYEQIEDEFHGTSYTASFLWEPGPRLRLGAAWTPAYDVSVAHTVAMGGVAAQGLYDWTMSMPAEYQVGFATPLAGRWSLGGEFQLQRFSEFAGQAQWIAEGMQDESTWSLGCERAAAFTRGGGLGNLPLRLGYRSHRWAYSLGGQPIDEWSVSVGTGFPFRNRMGYLDMALSYGRIGDLERNGLQDDVLKFTVSVTGLEKWW